VENLLLSRPKSRNFSHKKAILNPKDVLLAGQQEKLTAQEAADVLPAVAGVDTAIQNRNTM
jgi:hypothetical protein